MEVILYTIALAACAGVGSLSVTLWRRWQTQKRIRSVEDATREACKLTCSQGSEGGSCPCDGPRECPLSQYYPRLSG